MSSGSGEKAGCICTKEYRPAYGKDGKTQFGNACQARCAGVTDFTLGACHRGSMGSSGVGMQQTAADCKPGEVFKPFPCLVAPCKYGRCERCVNALGLQKEIEVAKPGAVISLDPNRPICGTLRLRTKSAATAANPITIRSSDPKQFVRFGMDNGAPLILSDKGVSGYRFEGIQFEPDNLAQFWGDFTTHRPRNITFQRCRIAPISYRVPVPAFSATDIDNLSRRVDAIGFRAFFDRLGQNPWFYSLEGTLGYLRDFNPRKDARVITGVTIAAGSTTLTASTDVFTRDDVGKTIAIRDAGGLISDPAEFLPAGFRHALVTQISVVQGPRSVILRDRDVAIANVVPTGNPLWNSKMSLAVLGHDDTVAIQTALTQHQGPLMVDEGGYLIGGELLMPNRRGLVGMRGGAKPIFYGMPGGTQPLGLISNTERGFDTSTFNSHLMLVNLRLDWNLGFPSTNFKNSRAVFWNKVHDSVMENLDVRNTRSEALRLDAMALRTATSERSVIAHCSIDNRGQVYTTPPSDRSRRVETPADDLFYGQGNPVNILVRSQLSPDIDTNYPGGWDAHTSQILVLRNRTNGGRYGAHAMNVRESVFFDNHFENTWERGYNISNGSSFIYLKHNYVWRAGSTAVIVDYGSHHVWLEDNTFLNTQRDGSGIGNYGQGIGATPGAWQLVIRNNISSFHATDGLSFEGGFDLHDFWIEGNTFHGTCQQL